MKIQLGKVLRELRIKNGFTQEKLAERLNLTPQAISRWESGAGYPDFEMIPDLAAALGTSTDTLFGIDREGEELKKFKFELNQRISKLSWREMIGEMRTAYETYPGDEELLLWMGSVLTNAAVKHKDELSIDESVQFYNEADILFNRVLAISTNEQNRQKVKTILVQELYSTYDIEKAIEMAAQLNSVGITMQNQTMPLLKGEQRIEFAKRWFPLMFAQLVSFALFARDTDFDIHDKNADTDIMELRLRKTIYESFYEYLGVKFSDRKNNDTSYRNMFLELFKKSENDDESLTALERYVELSQSVENEINTYGNDSMAILSLTYLLSNNEELRLKITNKEIETYGQLYSNRILESEKYKQKANHFSGNPRFEVAMEKLKKMGPVI
ncbi:MAG: helix-turn-helix domain-containing protein [Saccharofermentanales bacterium]